MEGMARFSRVYHGAYRRDMEISTAKRPLIIKTFSTRHGTLTPVSIGDRLDYVLVSQRLSIEGIGIPPVLDHPEAAASVSNQRPSLPEQRYLIFCSNWPIRQERPPPDLALRRGKYPVLFISVGPRRFAEHAGHPGHIQPTWRVEAN